MGPSDFGLSIFASFVANLLSKASDRDDSPVAQVVPVIEDPKEDEKERPILFKTFDTSNDFLELIEYTIDPIVHIVIEDEPSTYYHLPVLVLECRTKGEWFVFSRGRMAFEGSHGGWGNSVGAFETMKRNNIPVSVWIADVTTIRDLEGYRTWPELKPSVIPLLAARNVDHKWSTIQSNIKRLLTLDPSKDNAL